MKYASSFLLAVLMTAAMAWSQQASTPIYKEANAPIEDRISDLIKQMTLEDKVQMLAGDVSGFDSQPNARLGIPAMHMTDGPVGVRWEGKSTAFPVSVCMAATWDADLIYQLGIALAKETKAKGRNVILGPCVNIHRTPFAGRNFETFGEDPYLSGAMAAAYVKGVQSEHVIATTKHFACNNQEFERNSMDSRVDERTLHEIYLPAFKAAVQQGGAWAVMCAYNRLNGHYCSSNYHLLTDILKDEWGFKGFVMSDWGAVHSIEPTLFSGLDIEMPNAAFLKPADVINVVEWGLMKESKIDDKVRRMLRAMFAMGFFDQKEPEKVTGDTPEIRQVALKVAQSGIVLLKNDRAVLPMDKKRIKSVAVIGPNAKFLRTGGGGSSRVEPNYTVSPVEALQTKAKGYKVQFAIGAVMEEALHPVESAYLIPAGGKQGETGLLGEYYSNIEFKGDPVLRRIDKQLHFPWGNNGPEGVGVDYFSVRWTGKLLPPKTGKYVLGVASDDGSRLYINGVLAVDNWGNHASVMRSTIVDLKAGVPLDIQVEYYEMAGGADCTLAWQPEAKDPINEAIALAKAADMAIVFAGNSDRSESEGGDRETLTLPKGQDELISAIAAVNKNTVVVLNSGAAVLMDPWLDKVPAVVQAWFPGQEGGNAIADILLGTVNPSGKLITTFLKKAEDSPAFANYPGADDKVEYKEGVFVGYRWFDKNQITPVFPFGHGLSYTTFVYSDLKVPAVVSQGQPIEVSLTVKNTGTVAGAEVVQLYVNDEQASVERPLKELKGFSKVFLKPGEARQVQLTLKPEDLKFYDVCSHDWLAEPGKFKVMAASSSRDVRLTGEFELK
jgi:beta-glucosidase